MAWGCWNQRPLLKMSCKFFHHSEFVVWHLFHCLLYFCVAILLLPQHRPSEQFDKIVFLNWRIFVPFIVCHCGWKYSVFPLFFTHKYVWGSVCYSTISIQEIIAYHKTLDLCLNLALGYYRFIKIIKSYSCQALKEEPCYNIHSQLTYTLVSSFSEACLVLHLSLILALQNCVKL